MTRSEVRYALFRCAYGSADPEHEEVFNKYKPGLEKMGLSLSQFSVEWDIGPESVDSIITGARVLLLRELLDAPLVDEEGNVVEPVINSLAIKPSLSAL